MGLVDIPYNFLVGGDGHTYEGRGWHNHDALNHSLKNHTTLSVALIGKFVYHNSLKPINYIVMTMLALLLPSEMHRFAKISEVGWIINYRITY